MRWVFHLKENIGLVLFFEEITVFVQFNSIINKSLLYASVL